MLPTYSLLTYEFHLDLLSRPAFCKKDVFIHWPDGVLIPAFLVPYRNPFHIWGKNWMVLIQFILIVRIKWVSFFRTTLSCALFVKFELQWVFLWIVLILLSHLEMAWVSFDRNQTHTMSKHLICYHWCILPDSHFLDCHRWHFTDHDPSQGISQWGINSNQIELHCLFIQM